MLIIEKLFNEHLELLGVIDVKNSLANIASEISDYLDYFFEYRIDVLISLYM